MKRLLVIAATLSLSFSAFAQSKDAKDSDKLDLKKLEDKYWAAKDTDFSVVQNRTYTKANRFFTSVSYGTLVNDPYNTGRMVNVAAGYYFSERWGMEVSHMSGDVKDNDSTDEFKTQYHTDPNYNIFKSYTSINAIWVPFYAKMSFLDRSIMYFDIQFAAGVGQKQYEIYHSATDGPNSTQSTLGYNFDFTQQLFFAEHWAIRMDLKNQWSKQKKERSHVTGGQSRELPDNTINDSALLLGFTFFF